LLTHIRTSSGSGQGTQFATAVHSHLRGATGAGTSSAIAIRNVINIRVSASGGAGTTDVALWVNKGQPSRGKMVLPPHWSSRKPYYIPR
jgi:hypothetical protein